MPSSPGPQSVPQLKQPRNPISLRQVEVVLSRSVSVAGFVFCVQTVPALLSQIKDANPLWIDIPVSVFFLSVIVAILMSFIGRFVKIAHGAVAVTYLATLISWPFAVLHPHVQAANHWLYYVLTVGTALAAIAFSIRLATIYLFVVPTLYGIIRLTPAGGSSPLPQAILDSVYAIILGGAALIIVTMLRQAASHVDTAQGTALERYGHAVRQHATEVERVQVDSIVHDSVLTTLLSAARAYTPEAKELAATMAGNAIGHLHDAALVQPDDGTMVRLRAISKRIADAAEAMSPHFSIRADDVGARSIPVIAGEAIYSASVQAMVNSLQHAGDDPFIKRWIRIKGVRPTGIEVEVGDTGEGFDVDAVPSERIGVRVSLVERVSNAGGSTLIVSARERGTIVTLRWPTRAPHAPISLDGDVEFALGDGEALR